MSFFEALYSSILEKQGVIFVAAALFTRISLIVFFAPGIGERAIPVRVRLAAAISLSVILIPLALEMNPIPPQTPAGLVIWIFAEAINGFILGFGLRLCIFALQIAGNILAQHVSLSQFFGPSVSFDAEPPYATFLLMAGIALAVTANLHFYLAGAVVHSLEVFPLGSFPAGGSTAHWSLTIVGDGLRTAFALASPFIILGFIYSLALAAANRAMPQLMAAFVGAPAIVLSGFALFAAASPVMLNSWLAYLDRSVSQLFGVLP